MFVLFLAVALIYSSSHKFNALAEIKRSGIDCIPEQKTNIVNCCYKEYDTDTGETVAIYCAVCYDNGTGNLACDAYEKVESIKPPDGGQVFPKDTAPPPVGVAPPPPSTQTCPDNTALDANGNCTPVTQGPTDQGTTTQPPPSDDNNKPSKPKLPKGNILGELPQSGEELTTKKKNNKDNSPTPPTCPTDNSPIPPNCTLKPKF